MSAAHSAFVDALGAGMTVSAAVLALAAVVAWFLIAPGRVQPAAPPAAAAEAEAELAAV